MKLIDMHCDTILKMYNQENTGDSLKLESSTNHVDVKKLIEADSMVQFFAIFMRIAENKTKLEVHNLVLEIANRFKEEVKENGEHISLVKSYEDILANQEFNKISALLTLEGAYMADDKIERIDEYYEAGIRLITLVWNYESEMATSNTWTETSDIGLKPFGIESVHRMNELGIIIDVSHLSDGGFYDVAKYSSKPFIASHSNARAVTNHPRNIDDEMIRILSNRGGVTGINFHGSFLANNNPDKYSNVDDMIKHIRHIKNIGGIDVVSLGSDFDGITGIFEINDISEVDKLFDGLKKANFTEDEIEKIWYKNALRVIKDIL